MEEQENENQEKIKLTLHPEAEKNYNERGEALLLEVTATPRQRESPVGFVPDMRIAATFNTKEVERYQEFLQIPGGRILQRIFPRDDKDVGFKDEAYKNFARLCEKMQKGNPLRKYVSLKVLEDLVFDWVSDRYTGTTSSSLTDYILPRLEDMIRDYEIWIPIAHTHIPVDLPFETVIIKTFSETMFNALREEAKSRNSPDLPKFLAMLDHYQPQLQSMAAATMFVQAEPRRAYEVALEGAEKAIAILRLFSKAAFIPEVSSCCVPLSQRNAQAEMYFVFLDGMLASNVDGLVGTDQTHFIIGPEQINMMTMTGVGALIHLFFKEDRTDFEQDVFESMMVYSRGLIAPNPSDKLMYIFSALESLLLKNNTENIQQNIADRIAFVIASKPHERMESVENYKAAYNLRSQYVHHAQTVDDFDTLTMFLQTVWKFFFGVVHRELPKYQKKEDFLKALDLMKYSGVSPETA